MQAVNRASKSLRVNGAVFGFWVEAIASWLFDGDRVFSEMV
jgi:hypothetical protein